MIKKLNKEEYIKEHRNKMINMTKKLDQQYKIYNKLKRNCDKRLWFRILQEV